MSQQLMSIAPLLLIFVAMWVIIIRPQQKKAKQHQQMIDGLSKGDRIVTNGGVIGIIHDLQEKEISLEISKDTIIQIARPMVATKVEKPAKKLAEKKAKPATKPAAKKKTVSKK